MADTIVSRDEQGRATYLDRSRLWGVQTPQVFRWDLLHQAHRWAADRKKQFTDDGSLVEKRGHEPVIVSGEPGNWKVTSDADWQRAEDLLR